MDIQIMEQGSTRIAVVRSDGIILSSVDDALDLIADAWHLNECSKLVLFQENISDDFFELKTCIAGEILQKFTNYNMNLAIIGDFEKYNSKSLNDFIYECNKGKQILFKKTLNEALETIKAY